MKSVRFYSVTSAVLRCDMCVAVILGICGHYVLQDHDDYETYEVG
jgi:hypothetical protein